MNSWESPTAQQLAASASETPTGIALSRGRGGLGSLFVCLRHGCGTRHTLTKSKRSGQGSVHTIPQVGDQIIGCSLRLSREFFLNRILNNEDPISVAA